MPRKKTLNKKQEKEKTISETKSENRKEKLEITEIKKQKPRNRQNETDEIELENLIDNSFEMPVIRVAPSLRIRQAAPVEPLELDLADVPVKKDEVDDKLYGSIKGGNYSPKDNYQVQGAKGAYEDSTPKQVSSSSTASNFSTSNFGAPSQQQFFNNTETTGYPGTEQKQDRQYDTSIEDKAKEERKRTW